MEGIHVYCLDQHSAAAAAAAPFPLMCHFRLRKCQNWLRDGARMHAFTHGEQEGREGATRRGTAHLRATHVFPCLRIRFTYEARYILTGDTSPHHKKVLWQLSGVNHLFDICTSFSSYIPIANHIFYILYLWYQKRRYVAYKRRPGL